MQTPHSPARASIPDDQRLISFNDVLEIIPVHRTTIRRLVREKAFPAPIYLTRAKVFWRLSSILAWLEEREKNPVGRRAFHYDDKPKTTVKKSRRRPS